MAPLTTRPKQWAWNHFWTDNNFYKNNHTHKNAWCKVKVNLEVEVMKSIDLDALARKMIGEVRRNEDLWMQGA